MYGLWVCWVCVGGISISSNRKSTCHGHCYKMEDFKYFLNYISNFFYSSCLLILYTNACFEMFFLQKFTLAILYVESGNSVRQGVSMTLTFRQCPAVGGKGLRLGVRRWLRSTLVNVSKVYSKIHDFERFPLRTQPRHSLHCSLYSQDYTHIV